MNTFPSQPDEGYSEDPLNPSSAAHHASPAEMPDWLTSQLPRMPLSIKKSTISTLVVYAVEVLSLRSTHQDTR